MKQYRSEGELIGLLRRKYPLPAWVLISGVREGTGGGNYRTADAITVCCWPSRGVEIQGFEIKSSRVDWKREKKNLNKAEAIQKFCHRWWIVAGSRSVVQESELPTNWGLMVPHGDGLQIMVQAPLLKPKPLSHLFLASLLRNLSESQSNIITQDKFKQAVDEAVEQAHKAWKYNKDNELYNLKQLQQYVKEFEEKSGIQINTWNIGNIGEAVRLFVNSGIRGLSRIIKDYILAADDVITQSQQHKEQLIKLLDTLNKENINV